MVAVIEAKKAPAFYVGDIDAANGPLTLVVLDGRGIADAASVFGMKTLTAGELDGDPTWEDAAWQ